MPDIHSKAQRSYNMSRIKSGNTTPEMIVRRLVFALGYRYRLHCKDVEGKPDLVFRRMKKVIFVHGCFWHRHTCKHGIVTPKTRAVFWKTKFSANKKRDVSVRRQLRSQGWNILIIWECELRDTRQLQSRLKSFLSP